MNLFLASSSGQRAEWPDSTWDQRLFVTHAWQAQTIDSVMNDGVVKSGGPHQHELAAALAAWGISEAGVKGAYDLMSA
ncbi:MAG TPA: hypothetical protein VEK76_03700 [Candidatus Binatia bacterium]|nr:hypothetical protein [Candidatus Binatia bacterium]